jgi:hypothetical protein
MAAEAAARNHTRAARRHRHLQAAGDFVHSTFPKSSRACHQAQIAAHRSHAAAGRPRCVAVSSMVLNAAVRAVPPPSRGPRRRGRTAPSSRHARSAPRRPAIERASTSTHAQSSPPSNCSRRRDSVRPPMAIDDSTSSLESWDTLPSILVPVIGRWSPVRRGAATLLPWRRRDRTPSEDGNSSTVRGWTVNEIPSSSGPS